VSTYTYGTTNNQLVDISPTGNICAGKWNRNSGGGIADYTICNFPNPLPSTGTANTGYLPYGVAYVTATGGSVVSNPVEVYVHPLVTSVTLVGPTGCLSQGQVSQLDAQACYSATINGTPSNALLCAPSTITNPSQFACPKAPGVGSVPSCTAAIGPLSYQVGLFSVASINPETNQITAEQPGTTAITASIAGSGSSAGYFSTCPPKSISLTLANGETSGSVNHSVTQNLVTNVIDTQGNTITGLSLDYQSTDPIDISVSSSGAVTTSYPGTASITAICQPGVCNQSPINEVGLNGTGLSISSNAVSLNYQGTNSNYVWFGAPGQSQYIVPVELLTGTLGSTARMPFVPNSMLMDQLGTNLYMGSERELMIYSLSSNALSKQDSTVPGVVLAVAPDNTSILINDQVLDKFYIYSPTTGVTATFSGLGAAAAWTPDVQTLYITDSAALGGNHTDTMYVYNQNTGFTTYPLPCSAGAATAANPCTGPSSNSDGAQSLAVTVPSVGAYASGSLTVAHTWCPTGTVSDYLSMSFYPQGDAVYNSSHDPVQTDVLAATTNGNHILGAALLSGQVQLSDIGVDIPDGACKVTTTGTASHPVQTLDALTISHTLKQTTLSQLNGPAITQLNGVITSPISNLAFFTYNASPTNYNALLPYYEPTAANTGTLGTLGYVKLAGASATGGPTAPIAGAFTPDDTLFFVSTAGDNKVHYISLPSLTDTQQLSPNLPACVVGTDIGCTYPGADPYVPVTVIVVKPRTTT
jgi:hypothetical protein